MAVAVGTGVIALLAYSLTLVAAVLVLLLASVLYGLLILCARLEHGGLLFHLVALVTVLSIVAHSSTDVLVARWFRRSREAMARGGPRPAAA
jgi:hypothetical protein